MHLYLSNESYLLKVQGTWFDPFKLTRIKTNIHIKYEILKQR